jgi:predicted Zn-dependent protease
VHGGDDISPRFVVHAMALLSAGNVDAAAETCHAGITRYPWYATGYWVLGKCYEAQGNTAGAYEQYAEVAKRLSGVPAVQQSLERLSATLNGSRAETAGRETDVDFILRRLKEAKRLVAPASGEEKPLVDISAPKGETSIVTVTLAEIYAKQGDYKEAIEAYKKLIRQRPDDTGRYAIRIAELELLLQSTENFRQP